MFLIVGFEVAVVALCVDDLLSQLITTFHISINSLVIRH